MKRIGVCVTLFLVLMLFISCSMFTTSAGKPRDVSKSFEKASTQEIVDLLNSKQVLSSEDAKGIASALAKKDPAELDSLGVKDKGSVVNAIVAGVLPSTTDLVSFIGSDIISNMNTSQTEGFLNSILEEGFKFIDTSVQLEVIESYFNNSETVKDFIKEEADALLLGIFALTATLTKEGGVNITAENSFFSLFEKTLIKLGNEAYQNKEDSVSAEEKQILDKTLADSLKALHTSEKVSALVNAIVVLYIYSAEEGLSSFGGLEGLFSGLLGAEV